MTSTALTPKPTSTALAPPRTFDEAMAVARILAKSELVPKALRDKPEAIVLVGAMGAELGISFVNALSMIDVIEGRPTPSAQLLLAVIRRHGHEARFTFTDDDKAVLRARRKEYHDDPEGWVTVEFSAEQAEKAGYLDHWAERYYRKQGDRYDRKEKFFLKVSPDGDYVPVEHGAVMPDWVVKAIESAQVKRQDPWHKRRANMLRARAASDLFRMEFSDLRMGGPLPTFDASSVVLDDNQDDDVVDVEIVDEPSSDPGGTAGPSAGQGEPAPTSPASTGDHRVPPKGAPAAQDQVTKVPGAGKSGPTGLTARHEEDGSGPSADRQAATPASSADQPRTLAQQIAMRANQAGVDRAHVIAAVTGGAKTSAREVDTREGRQVLQTINDLDDGYTELAEVDGAWVINEAQPPK